jgi:bacillithiol system protein YtxJ
MADLKPLRSVDDWRRARSQPGRALVFKHSSTCPISAAARERFVSWAESLPPDHLSIYQVLVIEHRPLSQAIAADLGVAHQSPQAILLDHGRAVWHASHWAITADSLTSAVADPDGTPSHSTTLMQARTEHREHTAAAGGS